MDSRIKRARQEQIRLAALLKSGHSESEGIELAISDWFWEEMLIQKELSYSIEPTLYDTLATGQRAGRFVGKGQRRYPGATWAKRCVETAISRELL